MEGMLSTDIAYGVNSRTSRVVRASQWARCTPHSWGSAAGGGGEADFRLALQPALLRGFARQLSSVDRPRFLENSADVELDGVLAQVDYFCDALVRGSVD